MTQGWLVQYCVPQMSHVQFYCVLAFWRHCVRKRCKVTVKKHRVIPRNGWYYANRFTAKHKLEEKALHRRCGKRAVSTMKEKQFTWGRILFGWWFAKRVCLRCRAEGWDLFCWPVPAAVHAIPAVIVRPSSRKFLRKHGRNTWNWDRCVIILETEIHEHRCEQFEHADSRGRRLNARI